MSILVKRKGYQVKLYNYDRVENSETIELTSKSSQVILSFL